MFTSAGFASKLIVVQFQSSSCADMLQRKTDSCKLCRGEERRDSGDEGRRRRYVAKLLSESACEGYH
jgi:hypothetical protein